MSGELNLGHTGLGPRIARVERAADGAEMAWDSQGRRVYGYRSDPAIHAIWRENSRREDLEHNARLEEAWRAYRWAVLAAPAGLRGVGLLGLCKEAVGCSGLSCHPCWYWDSSSSISRWGGVCGPGCRGPRRGGVLRYEAPGVVI